MFYAGFYCIRKSSLKIGFISLLLLISDSASQTLKLKVDLTCWNQRCQWTVDISMLWNVVCIMRGRHQKNECRRDAPCWASRWKDCSLSWLTYFVDWISLSNISFSLLSLFSDCWVSLWNAGHWCWLKIQYKLEMESASRIKITVNGTEYTVLNPDPKIHLNEWLRNHLHLTGKFRLYLQG